MGVLSLFLFLGVWAYGPMASALGMQRTCILLAFYLESEVKASGNGYGSQGLVGLYEVFTCILVVS